METFHVNKVSITILFNIFAPGEMKSCNLLFSYLLYSKFD